MILCFNSKNRKVAKVNKSTGRVTLVGAGTTEIVIRASATDEYTEASKIIKLTVKKGNARLKTSKDSYTRPYKSKAFSYRASARCPMKFKSSNRFSKKGFGSYTPFYSVTDWKPGDIMSMKGHVWISLGMCRDGSVVLLHASPPGVLLCGTSLPDGGRSQAVELAESYMAAYYPDWYRKFPNCTRGASYQANSSQMRWSPQVLSDEEGIRNMGAEEVLKKLFNVP